MNLTVSDLVAKSQISDLNPFATEGSLFWGTVATFAVFFGIFH